MAVPEKAKALMATGKVMALATASKDGVPNVAPMAQCWWYDDETLLVGDFFMKQTRQNILENKAVSFSVWEMSPREAYKFCGEGAYHTEGALYEFANSEMKKKMPAKNFKGVVAIRVEAVYDSNSGPSAGDRIA